MTPVFTVNTFLHKHTFMWDGLYLKLVWFSKQAYHHLVSERSSNELEASLRIVHCSISNDFTIPKVITPATLYITVKVWLLEL